MAALRAGELVAFPTETVYGLGADATNDDALHRLYAAKGRPRDHPVIVHLGSIADLDRWGTAVSPAARALAAEWWPGPLTLIVQAAARVSRVATGGLETVGLRVPAHPLALQLLEAFGGGIAAPSANRFGSGEPDHRGGSESRVRIRGGDGARWWAVRGGGGVDDRRLHRRLTARASSWCRHDRDDL